MAPVGSIKAVALESVQHSRQCGVLRKLTPPANGFIAMRKQLCTHYSGWRKMPRKRIDATAMVNAHRARKICTGWPATVVTISPPKAE